MKLIFHYLKKHLAIFCLALLCLTVEAAADLLQPTFMSRIVDNGVSNADISLILRYGGIMLLIAAAGAFSAIMRNRFSCETSQRVGAELRHDMLRSVEKLSLENIDRLQPASIITRMINDVTQVQDFIQSSMRMMIKAPVTCAGAVTLILIQTPKQAPVLLLILLIAFVLIFMNIRVGYPRFGNVQKKLDGLNGVAREFLSAIRVVKAFCAEEEETGKFQSSSDDLKLANVSALQAAATFSPLISLTVNFGTVLLLWISKSQKASEIGRLMASVNYMTQVLFAINAISNVINTAVRAIASSERISEVLQEIPSQKQPEKPLYPAVSGEISFDRVSFKYAGSGRNALTNISFCVHSGQTVGIIGPTGSGKTTLINLIPRLYDATEGKVLLDGVDVTRTDSNHLRHAVATVAQKPTLFTGTVRENLCWGRPDAAENEIRQAAHIACADEFIEAMPDCYDTMLGQGGVNLSGGQKQRLSIARALIIRPHILILDDCTSALDAHTEATVLARLKEISGDITVLLISQRVSTVMRSDAILCLNDGEVQGFGTHRQLMDNCALYRMIYDSQIGGRTNG